MDKKRGSEMTIEEQMGEVSRKIKEQVEIAEWRMVREIQKAQEAAAKTLSQAKTSHERARDLADRAEESIRERSREEVRGWARALLDDPLTRIIALGTTGLDDPVDVVEVVVLDTAGEALLSERVRPESHVVEEQLDGRETITVRRDPTQISTGAAELHRHTAASLADAQTFAQISPRLREVLAGKRAVVYNAQFVFRVLKQTFARYDLEPVWALRECAMEQYARLKGDWSVEGETYYPVKLPGQDGTPIGNARALLALLREMADTPEPANIERNSEVTEEDFEDLPF